MTNSKMKRPQFITRTILLVGNMQAETAKQVISNAPIDPVKPLEIVIREQQKKRKQDQNALMWSGVLKDIAEQAWVNGRTYSAEVWHEWAKKEFLPEEYVEGLTKDGYKKYGFSPNGERVLVGSTTQLTVKGFSEYLEKLIAYGASLGVMFSTNGKI